MNTQLKKTLKHWTWIENIIRVPRNADDYESQLSLLNILIDLSRKKQDPHIASLLVLIAQSIDVYEKKKFLARTVTPVEVLQYLMEQQGLTQKELPEIGSQSLVSKILKNERHLTADQIGKLSKRFNVSPAVFYPLGRT